MKRSRILYGILTVLVMILGLSSRQFTEYLPTVIGKYSGDILWALMVYLGFGFIFRKLIPNRVAAVALLFSYSIEFSQIYHAPWIDKIRYTSLGGLVLGYGFLWSDFLCYTIGISIGFIIDIFIIKNRIV